MEVGVGPRARLRQGASAITTPQDPEHVAEIETLTSLQLEGHTRQLHEIALDHLVRARDDLSAVIDARSDPQVPAPRVLSAEEPTLVEPQLES